MSWWQAGGATGCVAAYQPIGAASLAASYSNLANPGTYDAAPGVAPTFDAATGWTFNGTTQYLTTGYTPPNQAAFSLIVRFSGGTTGNRTLMASTDMSGIVNIGIFQSLAGVSNKPFVANNGQRALASVVTSGVLALSTDQPYIDGVADGSPISASGASWRTLMIGAYNTGSATLLFSGNIQALAIYNTTLTGAQVAAVTTAMQGLPTASIFPVPIYAAQLAAYGA